MLNARTSVAQEELSLLQAVFVKPGLVEWRDVAKPTLRGACEAIVRPLVVGRCDLDVAYVKGLLPMPSEAPIGHEIIGEIVDLGESVGNFSVGDRVFVPAQISCGTCGPCMRGATGRCASVPFAASYGMGREGDFGGGLSDFVRVPFANAMLTRLPDAVEPVALIGAADMAADAWRGIGPHIAQRQDARVLVIGGMPPVIGLYAAGLASAMGAAEVHYVDHDHERCQIAKGYGARTFAHLAEIADNRYDLIFIANPYRAALESAFMAIEPGGIITSASPTIDGAPQIDTGSLYHRGVSWTIGRPDCRSAHEGTMSAWACSGFRPDHVPTTPVLWDDAPEAWSSDALYVAAVRA